jgi:hypothetical protein
MLAVAVSVAYVIRSTVDTVAGLWPPPNQPSFVVPVAANKNLAKLNGPLAEAVFVSVAYVIRSTEDNTGPG